MRTRPLVALSVAAVSALLLVGCSSPAPESTPDSSASASGDLCAAVVPSGAASDGVSVEGEPGEPATATFTTPLEITSAERTVVVEGDGAAIEDGDIVEYGVTVFDPATGEEVAVEGYASPILPVSVALGSGADQFFGCAPVGSRIVMALPETEQSAAAVWVLDVLGVDTEPRAEGEAQEPVDGFPTVVLAEDGAPTVTIPEGDIPTEFDKATLIKGEGDVIAAGDAVLVQYHGVSWNDGEVFDQSWGGAPFPFSTSGGVVQGFADAVIGETVGSQVIAVLPPSVAYGEGEINENDLVGQTLVFVVDILAVQPAVTE